MKKLFVLLLAMCLVLGTTTAFADTQEIKLDSATLRLPANMKIHDKQNNYCIAYDENCEMIVYFLNYGTADIDEDELETFYKGDIKKANLVFLATMALGKENLAFARRMADEARMYDFDMLNGERVNAYIGTNFVVCAQYYRNAGLFLYSAARNGKQVNPDTLGEVIEDIFRSFRLDGVTEEDMAADAQADYVVITADSGKIRTEASISGGLIKTAYKGETFELIEQSGDWYIVNVNGRTGYIHKGVAAIQ